MFRLFVSWLIFLCSWGSISSWAQSRQTVTITIKDHRFNPSPLIAPAGEKFQMKVDNQDPTPEEFESYDLNREKVVNGNKSIIVFLGPLVKGTYKYFGDFHQKTAQGVIIAQ